MVPSVDLQTETIDGQRFYLTPSGNKYPSVTTALSHLNKKQIAEWRQRVGEEQAQKISSSASSRGTKLHKVCEDYVLNKPEFLTENIVINQMFAPIKNYLDQHCDIIYGVETALYSDTLRLAGRCDLICRLHGMPCIVDFKTASKPKEEKWIQNYFMQTAAYSQMVYERYKIVAKWVCILISTEHDGLQVFYRQTSDYYGHLIDYLDRNRVDIWGN